MGEGEDGGEVREAAAAAGREGGGRGGGERLEGHVVDEDGVRRSPPMTGEGSRVRDSVATPGACRGGTGGAREGAGGDNEGGEGEAGWPVGGGSVGESNNCLDWVNDRLLAGPASSPPSLPLAPPAPTPPVMVVAVAMRMRAF